MSKLLFSTINLGKKSRKKVCLPSKAVKKDEGK